MITKKKYVCIQRVLINKNRDQGKNIEDNLVAVDQDGNKYKSASNRQGALLFSTSSRSLGRTIVYKNIRIFWNIMAILIIIAIIWICMRG